MIILAFKEVSNSNNFINLESSDLEGFPDSTGCWEKIFKILMKKLILKVCFKNYSFLEGSLEIEEESQKKLLLRRQQL